MTTEKKFFYQMARARKSETKSGPRVNNGCVTTIENSKLWTSQFALVESREFGKVEKDGDLFHATIKLEGKFRTEAEAHTWVSNLLYADLELKTTRPLDEDDN